MIHLKIAGMYVGDYDLVNGKVKRLVLVDKVDFAFNFADYEKEKMLIIVGFDGQVITGERRFVAEKTQTFSEYVAEEGDEDECDPVCDCRSCCGLD